MTADLDQAEQAIAERRQQLEHYRSEEERALRRQAREAHLGAALLARVRAQGSGGITLTRDELLAQGATSDEAWLWDADPLADDGLVITEIDAGIRIKAAQGAPDAP